MKLPLFCFFAFIVCSNSFSQKKRSIEIYTNPFIYRGNVNKQFTSVNNKYVDGQYSTPYIFETGFNYKVNLEKWGWYAGLSFMSEQQTFTMTSYIPDDHWVNPVSIFQYNFDSNYFGMKAGVNYSVCEKLILNFGVNVFNPISFLERGPFWNGVEIGLYSKYLVDPAAENPQTAEETFAKYEYKLSDLHPIIYLIPEFSLDYKILPNTHLTLGARFKFWTKQTDTRFTASVEGYFDHKENPQDEILHESEVTNRGLYTYIGLKYDIFLKKQKR